MRNSTEKRDVNENKVETPGSFGRKIKIVWRCEKGAEHFPDNSTFGISDKEDNLGI
jgi:hypothetical protein